MNVQLKLIQMYEQCLISINGDKWKAFQTFDSI